MEFGHIHIGFCILADSDVMALSYEWIFSVLDDKFEKQKVK